MTSTVGNSVNSVVLSSSARSNGVSLPDYDKSRMEDVGFLTAMTLVLLGNYAQTGHFGCRDPSRKMSVYGHFGPETPPDRTKCSVYGPFGLV